MQIYTFAAEKSNLKSMSKEIRLKKGLNINLLGEADKVYASVKPTDAYTLSASPSKLMIKPLFNLISLDMLFK